MQGNTYTLPERSFVGGASQTYRFNLKTQKGQPFDATGCTISFALRNYSNKGGSPELVKEADILEGPDGIDNIALIKLSPSDTISLSGKFVYQITIVDYEGEVDIPNQGILNITRNINPGYIAQGG